MAYVPSIRDIWDYQDPAASEQRFRGLLRQTSELSRVLEIQTQIARALGLQGEFSRADHLLDQVEDALGDDMPVARLRYLLERGRMRNSAGDPDRARPYFEEAWDLGCSIPHPDLAVDAAHMVAIVAPAPSKDEWNRRALSYAEESGDPEAQRWLGALYNNMGWDAHEAGRFEDALALLERAWAWHRERHTGSGERVAKWSVAKQLRFLDRPVEAMNMQEELLVEYLRDEPGGEGFVHEELAELLYAAGHIEGARPHFARAAELLLQVDWIEPERLTRLAELGGLAGS